MIGFQIQNQGNANTGCDFCKFATHGAERDRWIVWIQNCNVIDPKTGLPTRFYVYVQDRPNRHGSHKEYNAAGCGIHQWQAFPVMQETYLDEVKECDRTEAWLWRRNSRL